MRGMSVSDATRRLISELLSMLNRKVKVVLADGKEYEGVLTGFDHPTLNIVLTDALDNKGKRYPKVIIRGEKISEIMITEIPLFEPSDFAEYLIDRLKLRKDSVKVVPEAGAVIILGRIKVTEKGVEGSGVMAQNVYQVFQEYIEKRKSMIKG